MKATEKYTELRDEVIACIKSKMTDGQELSIPHTFSHSPEAGYNIPIDFIKREGERIYSLNLYRNQSRDVEFLTLDCLVKVADILEFGSFNQFKK